MSLLYQPTNGRAPVLRFCGLQNAKTEEENLNYTKIYYKIRKYAKVDVAVKDIHRMKGSEGVFQSGTSSGAARGAWDPPEKQNKKKEKKKKK